MYKVIKYFEDLQDNGRPYNVGDKFPFDDRKIAKERIKELLTSENRRRIPLIIEVAEEVEKPAKTKRKTKKSVEKTEE